MAKYDISPSNQIFLTAILVGMGAIFSFSSVLDVGETESLDMAPTTVVGDRGPASVQNRVTPELVHRTGTSALLKLDQSLCNLAETTEMSTESGYVQIHGALCPKAGAVEEMSITNEQNGHVGTVFLTGMGTYQTDVIPLGVGENHLRVSATYSNGKTHNFVLKVTHKN